MISATSLINKNGHFGRPSADSARSSARQPPHENQVNSAATHPSPGSPDRALAPRPTPPALPRPFWLEAAPLARAPAPSDAADVQSAREDPTGEVRRHRGAAAVQRELCIRNPQRPGAPFVPQVPEEGLLELK
eukprot:scaffold17724_cov129-Isochrysis_galbana.AAC.2